jgi:cell division protein FtsB
MGGYKRKRGTASALLIFFAKGALALILFVLMVLAARGAWGMYERFAAASSEAAAAKTKLNEMRERKAEIAAEVKNLSTSRGIEAEIRERYGVAKSGEGKIEIVHNSTAEEFLEAEDTQGIFSRIFRSLFIW